MGSCVHCGGLCGLPHSKGHSHRCRALRGGAAEQVRPHLKSKTCPKSKFLFLFFWSSKFSAALGFSSPLPGTAVSSVSTISSLFSGPQSLLYLYLPLFLSLYLSLSLSLSLSSLSSKLAYSPSQRVCQFRDLLQHSYWVQVCPTEDSDSTEIEVFYHFGFIHLN